MELYIKSKFVRIFLVLWLGSFDDRIPLDLLVIPFGGFSGSDPSGFYHFRRYYQFRFFSS